MGKRKGGAADEYESADDRHNSDGSDSNNDSDSSELKRRDRKRRKKERKKHRKHSYSSKKSRRREKYRDHDDDDDDDNQCDDDVDDDSHASSNDDESNSKHQKDKKRRKKHKKKKQKRSKKSSREQVSSYEKRQQNHELANSLVQLLSDHPGMSEELPILLIRLCSGSTFSFDQSPASQPLMHVLLCLEPFGVFQDDTTGMFGWKQPLSILLDRPKILKVKQSEEHKEHPELALLRVVQTLLDNIGLTATAVLDYEQGRHRPISVHGSLPQKPARSVSQEEFADQSKIVLDDSSKDIPLLVQRIVHSFPCMQKQLVHLCEAMLQGERVALDAFSVKEAKEPLSNLFDVCQLVQPEVENNVNDPSIPPTSTQQYALPGNSSSRAVVTQNIKAVLQACTTKALPRRVVGPMRPPPSYAQRQASDENEEEEGPQLFPSRDDLARSLSESVIKAQVNHRQVQMQRVKAGLDSSSAAELSNNQGREEWMLEPGEHEFLDEIKSGKTIRNRQFQNIKTGDNPQQQQQQGSGELDPEIQSEMKELMMMHQETRGPSLMDEHQAAIEKKQREQEQLENNKRGGESKKRSWKWNRTQDLDAGRRVDKDALQTVLGGAATGLKTKFQGSFQSGS